MSHRCIFCEYLNMKSKNYSRREMIFKHFTNTESDVNSDRYKFLIQLNYFVMELINYEILNSRQTRHSKKV